MPWGAMSEFFFISQMKGIVLATLYCFSFNSWCN